MTKTEMQVMEFFWETGKKLYLCRTSKVFYREKRLEETNVEYISA